MSHNWREDYRNKSDSELYRIFMGNREHHNSRLNKEFAESILMERSFNFKNAEDNFFKMNGKSILYNIENKESQAKFSPSAWKIFLFLGPGLILFIYATSGFRFPDFGFIFILIVFAISATILVEFAKYLIKQRLKKLHKKFDKIIKSTQQ